jgi:hypothetical protein
MMILIQERVILIIYKFIITVIFIKSFLKQNKYNIYNPIIILNIFKVKL